MRKEIKKLIAATMSMALVLGVGNTVNIKAGTNAEDPVAARAFCISVKEKCEASIAEKSSTKRTSKKTDNAWSVKFISSTESTSGKTSTRFYLGKVISNGTNQYGSPLHTIRVGEKTKYYSAYPKACPATVCLYARDNEDGTTGAYSVTGRWSPQSGNRPVND